VGEIWLSITDVVRLEIAIAKLKSVVKCINKEIDGKESKW
jgi:hypothetical protein